jgi:hypothetical protein
MLIHQYRSAKRYRVTTRRHYSYSPWESNLTTLICFSSIAYRVTIYLQSVFIHEAKCLSQRYVVRSLCNRSDMRDIQHQLYFCNEQHEHRNPLLLRHWQLSSTCPLLTHVPCELFYFSVFLVFERVIFLVYQDRRRGLPETKTQPEYVQGRTSYW